MLRRGPARDSERRVFTCLFTWYLLSLVRARVCSGVVCFYLCVLICSCSHNCLFLFFLRSCIFSIFLERNCALLAFLDFGFAFHVFYWDLGVCSVMANVFRNKKIDQVNFV